MAAAYAYAAGKGEPPQEYTLSILIRDYGVRAIMNRDYLGAGEIKRMRYCERIVEWYNARQRALNWVVWAQSNPDESAALNRAGRAYEQCLNNN